MKKIILAFLLGISVSAQAQVITTFAGNGSASTTGDGGLATAASFNNPGGAFYDRYGNVYVVELTGNVIRKIDLSNIVHPFAGTGSAGFSGDGGPATAARFNNIIDIIADLSGNLYITDNGNQRIRKIDTFGIITTYAGNGSIGYTGDGGPSTACTINYPSRFGIDASGNLYFADAGNNVIRKINTSGIITTVAGMGAAGFSGDGGAATAAKLSSPLGVTFDGNGNMYIADASNHRIRKVNNAGIISTFAGTGSVGYTGDGGPATAATLDYPSGVAADATCNIYFTDWHGQTVRKINASGTITKVVGTGTPGFSGDGGTALAAEINGPNNLTFDPAGNLYIPEFYNNRIRKVANLGEHFGCPALIPIAAFTMSDSGTCKDSCLYFHSGTVGTIDSLRWSTIPAGGIISNPTSTNTTICFPISGSFVVKLKAYGNSGSDSSTFTVHVYPAPQPHITQSGHTFSVTGSGYTSYQWFNSAIIPGATNSSYVFAGASGIGYYVVVDSNGCKGTSNTLIPLGIESSTKSDGNYWISKGQNAMIIHASEAAAEPTTIAIFDMTGRCLGHDSLPAGAMAKELQIPFLATGLYIIRLSNNNSSTSIKWLNY